MLSGVAFGVAFGAVVSLLYHESQVLGCDGCHPKVEVRHFHWQTNGQGVWDWYTGGGQLGYSAGAAQGSDHEDGSCHIDNGNCVPNPEDRCVASYQLTIDSYGSLSRFVSDASGCVTWGDLAADQKTLTSRATVCDAKEVQDEFKGYNNTGCTTGPAAGPEKVVLAVWCTKCELTTDD